MDHALPVGVETEKRVILIFAEAACLPILYLKLLIGQTVCERPLICLESCESCPVLLVLGIDFSSGRDGFLLQKQTELRAQIINNCGHQHRARRGHPAAK